ncbi:3-hydroxyacyl-CoA dehydrogenase family protein [Lysinibacillus macroides]|uniref:L-gulonate 3-dehydrogenase n=1 Tax=Lysinibacillus macroides TaxID=33935 RepID=A0A0M9DHV4_9BACI|nr:3-hydroxyacyl-CoA dehydrogenase NAD-binding domain-containing protein [Lysinibacillus macroides]KOY81768.1 3-hydroxybutyryl-CoA dehydrogenase [Lysinibacillus macroides]QPR67873.1 3-hydroxyacyl-CoA dehydrogenase family protein [Lysinibacillus macroides]
METISIIGCGTMGHSIALSAAWAGMQVKMHGMNQQDIHNAKKGLQQKINVLCANDMLKKEEANHIQQNIILSDQLDEVIMHATFIIEAIPEILDLKKDIYQKIESVINENVVIASNTSGFKPSLLAENMQHPERLIVTHFWNPAHLIPLVEVVKGEQTNLATVERAMQVMKAMHKHPILLHKEILGFIGNRLQYALFREAQSILDAGVATKEDIDAAVTYSIGRRLPVTGPLMTADMGGLDVFSAISNYLFEDLSTVSQSGTVLTKLVDEGKLGDKSGEGFYTWDADFSVQKNTEREQTLIHFLKNDLKIREEKE